MLFRETDPVLNSFLSFTVSLWENCLILRHGFPIFNVRVVMSTSEAHRTVLNWVSASYLSNGDQHLSFQAGS